MDEEDLELKTAYVFGRTFTDLPGLINDLVSLEKEGCLYSHFYDYASDSFKYYKIALNPKEIFEYVEAHIAKQEFDNAIDNGGTFEDALNSISNEKIALRVESFGNYGKTELKDGGTMDIRGCFGSFLPEDLHLIVTGNKHNRYENLIELSKIDKNDLLYYQLDQFPIVANFLSKRTNKRPNFVIENEYDVQDLLYSNLRSVFENVKIEEWTIQHAGKSKRIDIVLPDIDTVLEVKMVRNKSHGKSISDELKIDIESYHAHPNCKKLVCFIYDPNKYIIDPTQMNEDLTGRRVKGNKEFEVRIFIR